MPDPAFVDRLNEQIGYEFGASQQYVAAAVYYDNETLPRLAAFFYAQALEERNHAMMMVQYLMDADAEVVIPGIAAPQGSFGDIVEPVRVALEQEKRVTGQINALAALAREAGDYSSEQFMQWFIKEQIEEVASMSDLLRVVERSRENPLFAEDFLAREQPQSEAADATAPAAAGAFQCRLLPPRRCAAATTIAPTSSPRAAEAAVFVSHAPMPPTAPRASWTSSSTWCRAS
jgi:bacterioferritin B